MDTERDERGRRGSRLSVVWSALVLALVLAVGAVAAVVVASGEEAADEASSRDHAESELVAFEEHPRWRGYVSLDASGVVAVAPDGDLWVGTPAGVVVRWNADGDGYTRHRLGLGEGSDPPSVRALAVSNDNTVWAGTRQGVARFDGERWTANPGEDAPRGPVTSLAVDDDTVWAVTRKGLRRFDEGRWRAVEDGGSPGEPFAVAVDADGAVWAATDQGVGRLSRGEWTTWTNRAELPPEWIRVLAIGPDGSVWLATSSTPAPGLSPDEEMELKRHLLRFDGQRWAVVAAGEELPEGRPESLAVDARGEPWLGLSRSPTDGSSRVARFHGPEWTVYTSDDGLPHNRVFFLTAEDGAVFAATGLGPARFDDGEWTTYTTGRGPPGDVVASVATDEHGRVWLGSLGLGRFDGQDWARWGPADGLPGESVRSVAVAPDGAVWAATDGGVSRLDGDGLMTWGGGDGFDHDQARLIAVGDDGTVWAVVRDRAEGQAGEIEARSTHHIVRFDGQEWTTVTPAGALAGRRPTDLAVDDKGGLWLSTSADEPSRRGVVRVDGNQWQLFTTDDGLPDNTAKAVATDEDGTVWVGTDRGIARFDGRRWASADTDGNPLGLPEDAPAADHGVSGLTVDKGTVWVATRDHASKPHESDEETPGHLSRFDGQAWAWDNAPVSPGGAIAVHEDTVWLGGFGELLRFDGPAAADEGHNQGAMSSTRAPS